MKNISLLCIGLAVLLAGPVMGADKKRSPYNRSYGKITMLDLKGGELIVYNKKRKSESHFNLDPEMTVRYKKQEVPKTGLKVGQNLIVYHLPNDNVAKKITIRSTAKKKKKQL